MPIEVTCAKCAKRVVVQESMAGKTIRCLKCGGPIVIPTTWQTKPQTPPRRAASPPRTATALPTTRPCRGCGVPLDPSVVLCTACGTNQSTGQRVATVVQAGVPGVQPRSDLAEKRREIFENLQKVSGLLFAILAIFGWLLLRDAFRSGKFSTQWKPSEAASAHPIYLETVELRPHPADPLVLYAQVPLSGQGPGLPMNVRVYLPAGTHPPHSLPCIFIAPAGTRLYHGLALTDQDSIEHVPYVHAGFAVIAYDLSGPLAAELEGMSEAQIRATIKPALQAFMDADGGMANARNAVDFALAKIDAIDPARLFAAGHSSAANVALDVATADPRIRGVCAYAPATDVEKRLNELMSPLESEVGGARSFLKQVSPMNRIGLFTCPVFLFHADDDANVPLDDNQNFELAMTAQHKDITFKRVPSGGHFESMRDQGIPAGIEWLKTHGAAPLSPPAPTPPVMPSTPAVPPAAVSRPPRSPAPPAAKVPTYSYDLTPGELWRRADSPTSKHFECKVNGHDTIDLSIMDRLDNATEPGVRVRPFQHPKTHWVLTMMDGQVDDVVVSGVRFVRVRSGPQPPGSRYEPYYSVCMGAYEGDRYVEIKATVQDTPSDRDLLENALATFSRTRVSP